MPSLEERVTRLEQHEQEARHLRQAERSAHAMALNDLHGALLEARTDMNTGFARVDERLATIETDVGTLKSDVGTLKSDVGTLKSDMGEVKTTLAEILLRLPPPA